MKTKSNFKNIKSYYEIMSYDELFHMDIKSNGSFLRNIIEVDLND